MTRRRARRRTPSKRSKLRKTAATRTSQTRWRDVALLLAVTVVWLARWLWRHPRTATVLGVVVGGWLAVSRPWLWAPVIVVGLAVAGRSWSTRQSWALERRRNSYRRRWRHLMAAHRLSWDPHPSTVRGQRPATRQPLGHKLRDRAKVPNLGRIDVGPYLDRLHVRLLTGQTPEDWEAQVDGIAHALGARDGRIRVPRPGRVVLELCYADPLTATIPALPIPARTDLRHVSVGRCEDGSLWTLAVEGGHLLVVGETGSGKGSVTGSILRGLCPAIRDGLVEVWAVDPKGGMELAPYEPLFARFAWETEDDMVGLLEEAVAAMQARQRRLRRVTRKHHATVDEPHTVIVIDELAALTAYSPDGKKRVSQALPMLLSQGRAVGFAVVAAVQDPRQDTIVFRQLFPTRLALRLHDPDMIDRVLRKGARDMGAHCDRIPESMPGTGYVLEDGKREPVRVRAAYVTDQDIAAMCANYGGDESRGKEVEVVAA